VLGLAMIAALGSPAAAHGTCAGDCDGNGAVTIEELILAVDAALGPRGAGGCAAADSNNDGQVTIDELIAAVASALNGCGATPTPTFAQAMLITGGCAQPGPTGLKPCALGTGIVVWRCDSTATCIQHVSARTRLGDGAVGAAGGFTVTVDATAAGHAALLMEASVSNATLFRVMDFGSVGGNGPAFRRTADPPVELSGEVIDPSSEAAIRLLDEQGLDQFAPDGVRAVIAAVRAANATTDFAGLEPEAAAEKALAVARDNPGVKQALAVYRFTVTPTATGTATATSTASATATRTASATATPTGSPPATATRTRTGSATATSTRSSTPTRTRTPTASATATRTATPSATATRTRTSSATATATRTVTLTRTPTHTPTPGLLAQLTTDRGCLETNPGAAYTVGEQATVFFQVDGVAPGGVSIAQVHVKIADYSNNQLVNVGDLGPLATATTFQFSYPVQAPTGTETLQLLADADPIALTAQTQCSFSVQPSAGCTTACDCPSGQSCDNGSCFMAGNPVYCCTSATCPSGATCQSPSSAFSMCP